MRTEKIIRQQAKNSLKGNWTEIIFAVMFLCAIYILLQSAMNFVTYFLGLRSLETGVVYDDKQWIYKLAVSVITTTGLMVSPILSGVLKMCANVALQGKIKITDVFYYFGNLRAYIRTLILNSALFIICMVLFFGLDVYALACCLLDTNLHNHSGFDIITLALWGASVLTTIIRILIYLIFVHYPLVAYALNDGGNFGDYFIKCVIFAVKNLGNTIKLLISFVGWIALCFFVAPLFYVLPYVAVSAMVSAKWLFLLDNNSLFKNQRSAL